MFQNQILHTYFKCFNKMSIQKSSVIFYIQKKWETDIFLSVISLDFNTARKYFYVNIHGTMCFSIPTVFVILYQSEIHKRK